MRVKREKQSPWEPLLAVPGFLVYGWPVYVPLGAGLYVGLRWHNLATGIFLALVLYLAIVAFRVYHHRWALTEQVKELAKSLRTGTTERDSHVKARLGDRLLIEEAMDKINQLSRELKETKGAEGESAEGKEPWEEVT